MKALQIVVRPQASSLAIGGYSQPRHGGDHATARAADGRPIIPASALRGALRIELERLLRGRNPQETACSANRDEGGEPCTCAVCRLFGQPGTAAGSLRLNDAVLADASDDEATASHVRPRVALSRQRRGAVEKLLGFVETTPPLGSATPAELRAEAWLVTSGDHLAEDLNNLEAACAAVRAIGGGKARGMGWVTCEVVEVEVAVSEEGTGTQPSAPVDPLVAPAGGVRLRFEALAPLHFGLGPPLGYFQPSRQHAMGSTVRGAVAFALLEHDICSGKDPGFQQLVAKASFGSARITGDRPSATRRHCRPGPKSESGKSESGNRDEKGHVFDDLVPELLRRWAARKGISLAVDPQGACPEPGCRAVKVAPEPYSREIVQPRVRVRTRTALNRPSGTSMDAKLFSHEILEPRVSVDEGAEPQPIVFVSEVWNLDAAAAALLGRLDGREVWLGGKRSQGMGVCRLRVEAASPPDPDVAWSKIAELKGALEEGWAAVTEVAGQELKPVLEGDEEPVAIVVTEPWLPAESPRTDELEGGPLRNGDDRVRCLGSFVRLVEEGRFGALEANRYDAPESVRRGEVPHRPVVDAGSVYVYAVSRATLGERLDEWLAAGRTGSGERWREGWGRFVIRGLEKDF